MPSQFIFYLLSNLSINRFLILCFFVMSAFVVVERNWIKTLYPIQMDANGYYIYLPAIFIYNDLGKLDFVNKFPKQFDRKYFLYPSQNGGYLTKYSPGIAILELPFFAVAHVLAPVFGSDQSGYSPPYRLAVALSTIFYTFTGLWLLSKVLLKYFENSIVFTVVALLFFGTNLLFYTVLSAGISHNYVFCALSFSLLFGEKWLVKRRWQDFTLACAGIGLSTLIRPTEALSGLILIGFLWSKWWKRGISIGEVLSDWKSILGGLAGFLFTLAPLFFYWKIATGNWIAYTYEEEGFYFDRPMTIWYGLFGFRKGLFIYTPLMLSCVIGIYYLLKDKRLNHISSAMAWYFPINIFIVLSWYCWWYGGCFGMRALIPTFALLAFPLAALLQHFKEKRIIYRTILGFSVFCIGLNIFQSYQYQQQILHMDAMTWPAYKYIFGKAKLKPEEKAELSKLLDHPGFLERGKKLDEYFK